MSKPSINLVVLVSGSGTTLQNLIDLIDRGELEARIVQVIGSRENLGAEARAIVASLPYAVIRRRDFFDGAAFSREIFLKCAEADLVVCAGWLSLLEIPASFEGRVINVHPSLLPKYGGHGMFGRHVHEAVLAAHEAQSGCTVHFLDNEYDQGPIILQRTCDVRPGDDATSLAARVQAQERVALPDAIRLFSAGRVKLEGRRVMIS